MLCIEVFKLKNPFDDRADFSFYRIFFVLIQLLLLVKNIVVFVLLGEND
jgi:hypothetical protein